jgi:hypothetical protein
MIRINVSHNFLQWLNCVHQQKRPGTDRRFRAYVVKAEPLLGLVSNLLRRQRACTRSRETRSRSSMLSTVCSLSDCARLLSCSSDNASAAIT